MVILRYPNEVLITKCPDYDMDEFETDLLSAYEMDELMRTFPTCKGLAANQVGILKRFFIIKVGLTQTLFCFNPVIIGHGSDLEVRAEKCMSCGEIMATVPRWRVITAKFIDHERKERIITLKGFEARVFQHELDHLNGKLIIRTEADDA